MFEYFRKLFSSDFMPHGTCYLWNPGVLWLNVVSDAVIAVSYYAIPILLLWFVRKRRDLSFQWVFVAFAAFILACGSTHAMGVWDVWHGTYRLDGLIKAITAVASVVTAVLLVPLMPKLIALPSPARLSAEITQRAAAEERIRQINTELEARMVHRTADLARTNDDLQAEIKRREEAEDRLVQAQKMEAVGRLAGGIAHDFNNLLTVMLGYTGKLRNMMDPDDPAGRMASEVQRAAEQAALVTGQLLTFSRKQANRPRTLDVNNFIQDMQNVLERLAGEDIHFAVSLQNSPCLINADEGQLSQVLMNLVVNARDAMPTGGQLAIETRIVVREGEDIGSHDIRPAGRYVMLVVTDTGLGMDPETTARLFEPFFTTKAVGKGTGLGLAIVFGVVKQHGGWVDVYSEPGHGSAFKIYLPEVAGAPFAATAPAPAHSADVHGTVLLVEDQAAILLLGEDVLAEAGHQVLTAANGPAAIKVAEAYAGPIELLVTDVVMPGMSGPELASHLRRSRPGLRVLYTSGYTDHALFQRGVVEVGTAFLAKPFQPSSLAQKVAEMMSLPQDRFYQQAG